MKVFELLREDVTSVTEEQVIARLQKFDWKYEYAEDFRKITKGMQELELLENLVYRLWKDQPERAVALWNEYAPGTGDPSTVPSFLLRLQAQE